MSCDVPYYRKKPVVIQALQFTKYNGVNIEEWSEGKVKRYPSVDMKDVGVACGEFLQIPTLEGTMTANLGDWVIKGLKGEVYPCKPDIFEASYETA